MQYNMQFYTLRIGESNNNGNWHTQLVQTKFNVGSPRLDLSKS